MDDRGISPIDPHRRHHRPAHLFLPDTMYIVTASTLHKRHFFRPARRIARLQQCLFEAGEAYGWRLEAWAFFSNHYHLIAQSPKDGSTLREMVRRVYSQTAREINAEDNRPGRQVWFEFWDTCLTFERSYYARLNYVHDNPKKHGLVSDPEDYTFCSARWFRENAEDAFRRKVESFRYDRIKIEDDFDVGDGGDDEKGDLYF